jgi:hypothetical protein
MTKDYRNTTFGGKVAIGMTALSEVQTLAPIINKTGSGKIYNFASVAKIKIL